MQTPVKARGEQFLEMDSYLTKSKNGDLIFGTLHRFTAIEAMSWYNTEKHQRATASERRQIRVPPNIAANYREIPFAVHLESHTMVFATKTSRSLVSPTQVQSFVVRLAAYPAIYSEFGNIEATLEQDEQELERILKSDSIKMLRITVKRPNESFRRFDPTLFERMNRLRAKSLSEEYHAEDKASIEPDQEAIDKAYAATSNGSVDAKVIVNGAVENLSTLDKPLQERVTYDTQKEGFQKGFRRGVQQIIDRIAGKKKNG
jgi:hypothetical protein